MQEIKNNILEIFKIIRKPQMRILPGQLAFFFILSLIPIITVIFDIAGLLSISIESINEFATTSLPEEIANIIMSVTSNKTSFNIDTAILFVVALVLASNGVYSIIMTSNFLHEEKSHSYIKNRFKAVILTFLIIVALLFTIFVLAFGETILIGLQSVKILSTISSTLLILFEVLKFPLGFLIIYLIIKLVYIIAPSKHIKNSSVGYGAAFTSIMWIISTFIFTLYVEKYANYGVYYGPLSNIIALMIWIYILSYIFVLGISINIGLENKDINLQKIKQIEKIKEITQIEKIKEITKLKKSNK